VCLDTSSWMFYAPRILWLKFVVLRQL